MKVKMKITKEITPFSVSYVIRVLHYDIVIAVINLKHMQDTAEGNHPKYMRQEKQHKPDCSCECHFSPYIPSQKIPCEKCKEKQGF